MDVSKYKKIQAGDKVRPKNRGITTVKAEGEVDAWWDASGNTLGTVVEVTKFGHVGNSPPWIYVEPDSPGFGKLLFNASELEVVQRNGVSRL